jgi:nitrogen fixation protein FixH
MKINWGKGIVIGMALFMAFIITLAVKMMGRKVDLVATNYYEQGIEFEKHIQSQQAVLGLDGKIEIKVDYTSKNIVITYPTDVANGSAKGNILLFRPSNAAKDFSVIIQPDTSMHQTIPLDKMAKGLWQIQLQWKQNNKEYYFEKEIII